MKDFKVPALAKGLDILEALSASSEPMSLTELSRALDRSTSELYRMIGFLETRGYIVKEPYSGNYRLSLKLYELAHTHSPVDQLIRAATIPMRELSAEVKESCHLSVLRSTDLLVLRQEESPLQYRLSVEVGGRFDAVRTASGRLLLAYLPEAEREWFLQKHPGYQGADEAGREALLRKLEEIRKQGYSHAESEYHIGVTDYAVLVGNPRIGLTAALAVPCLRIAGHSGSDEALLARLKACAAEITGALGITLP